MPDRSVIGRWGPAGSRSAWDSGHGRALQPRSPGCAIAATCDLDAPIVRGETPFTGPLPLGHECIAEVVEIGDGVNVRPGRLVSVPFQISCGRCERCRRGQTAHCDSVPSQSAYGLPPRGQDWGGFLSDVVHVPYADHMLVELPDGIEPAAAASEAVYTDGPFPELKELVTGYYVIEAPDADTARRVAALCPTVGRLEMWPVFDTSMM